MSQATQRARRMLAKLPKFMRGSVHDLLEEMCAENERLERAMKTAVSSIDSAVSSWEHGNEVDGKQFARNAIKVLLDGLRAALGEKP